MVVVVYWLSMLVINLIRMDVYWYENIIVEVIGGCKEKGKDVNIKLVIYFK